MAEPLVHLICGGTGAGKTTYALDLTGRIGGVRFSIDAWMTALFWMDSPQPLVAAWSIERVERCYAMIWTVAATVAVRGVPIVLDLGLTTRASRVRFAGLARDAGLVPKLHWIDVSADERWRRVEARNMAASGQLDFAVTRDMFDFVEMMWEAPEDAEMRGLDGIRVAADGPTLAEDGEDRNPRAPVPLSLRHAAIASRDR